MNLLQSKIEIPDGYEGIIYPSPKAARNGLVVLGEHVCVDPRLARSPNTTVMLEMCNRIGSMYYRPKDYLFIPRGHVLGLMKIVKKRCVHPAGFFFTVN